MPIFRYTETAGNYYAYLIESSGDDLNDGLTPETAVATLDRLVEILDTYAGASRRHAVIVKNRIYNEGITYTRNISKPITFEFVGGCEIDGSGTTYPQFNIYTDIIIGAKFINYYDAIVSLTTSTPLLFLPVTFFINCQFLDNSYAIVLNNTTAADMGGGSFFKCIIINSILSRTSLLGRTRHIFLDKTIIINCIGNNYRDYTASILRAKNTIFSNNPNLESDYQYIDYCNIVGDIGNTDYAGLQLLGYNLNGISVNPQFNDSLNGVYTVQSSSPCLYRGEGAEHIGIGEGFYLQANILYFQRSTINNFQLTLGNLGLIDPLDNAFIETNPIDIGQFITLEKAELAAILPVVAGEFTAGPVSYSHWYPAYSAASTYHKGAGVTDNAILYRSLADDNLNNTPASSATEWERLTWDSGVAYDVGKIVQYTDNKWYKANTTTSTSWVAGEWDEVVMIREWNLQVKTGRTYDECDAADWAKIPYNAMPYLDTAGLGNSDDDYDTSTGAVMVFRFLAVRIDVKTIA